MSETKENILVVALHLFAREGYEAVSVSRISSELGMTKGALYRHYQSKRDIFDHIVKRMEQGDSEQAENCDMPETYEAVTLEKIVKYSKSMFAYWTENDFAASFRKMLTLEQFRNEEMQSLYQQYLAAGPVGYVKDLFESIGIADAGQKAAVFYATMFLHYSLYDGAQDKEKIKAQFELALENQAAFLQARYMK